METLPMLVFHLERFDMTISSPMYPYRIARIVSKMTAPPEKLLLQAHSHTYFKVGEHLVIWDALGSIYLFHIDGLVQDCSNSSALAMELLQSCTKPSI